MAADITARCARSIRDDPVRFDFSICHVGMMNACGFGRRQGDSQCPLKGHCHPRVRRRADRARAADGRGCAAAIALSAACRRRSATITCVKSSTAPDTHHVAARAPGALRDGLVREAGIGADRRRRASRSRRCRREANGAARSSGRRDGKRVGVRDQRPPAAALRSGRRTRRPARSIWCRATAIRRPGSRAGMTFSENGAAMTFDDCPREKSGCQPRMLAIVR